MPSPCLCGNNTPIAEYVKDMLDKMYQLVERMHGIVTIREFSPIHA